MGCTKVARSAHWGWLSVSVLALPLGACLLALTSGLGAARPAGQQETGSPTNESQQEASATQRESDSQESLAESTGQEAAGEDQQAATGLNELPGVGATAPIPWETDDEKLPFSLDPDDHRFRRLGPDDQVWIDVRQKIVVVGSFVALDRGLLEMFACPKGTKEHESVVAVNSRSFIIHAGLLAVGAKPGHPVKFDPTYEAATGQEIEVFVIWEDEGKPRWARGQDWVRDQQKEKVMETPWVFGGSGFWRDDDTGERHYMAESGELICLSNFTTAMLDLPVQSSDSNAALLFEANTDAIPARGTRVTMVLMPKAAEQPEGGDSQGESNNSPGEEDK